MRSWRTAEELATETGDIGKQSLVQYGLARTLHTQGRHDEAIAYWDRAESAAHTPQVDEVRAARKQLTCACGVPPTPPPAR